MVARAIDAHLAERHAGHFAGEEPCPTYGQRHPPKGKPHDLPLQTDDGEVMLREPAFRCPPCERDFFPQRIPLRLDGRSASPAVLDKKVLAAAHAPSYATGELTLRMKGSEKFWNDGPSAEAILHLRAAALCEDNRLTRYLKNRPGHPFHPNVTPLPVLATAL